jgi:putative DNA primase/helicase
VIWGDPSKATTAIICEGIETAAAVALAFDREVGSGETMIAACINAGGIEAFKSWPAAKRVIVAADRDETPENGRAATRRGEVAAKRFAELHRTKIATSIALPGEAGQDVDWLNVLERTGMAAVRDGVLAAEPFARSDTPQNQQQESDAEEIARLVKLSPLEYDREREQAAKKLGCRSTTLDALVKAARPDEVSVSRQGRPITLPEVEPWGEPVAGARLLDELSDTISTYVIVSKEQADAIALWCVHAHAHDISDVSPHLVLKSAQKRSGKSRVVHLVERLVARPLSTSGITASALFRIIEMKHPTLLLDELDAVMNKDREMAEALRGIMNSAFERAGARCILNVPVQGGGYEPREFSTWAPLLLAGIGNLPDTVRDRSVEIEMIRKRRDETVRRLRRRDGQDLNVLARKSARWINDKAEKLQSAVQSIPKGLSDRAADAWEPLLAIADLAGGEWPQRARRATVVLSGEHVIEDENTDTQLLSDIRYVFTTEHVTSQALVSLLNGLGDRRWAEFGRNGKGLTPNTLARLLKPYKIRPATIRTRLGEEDTAKGYKLSQFTDVFERYLPNPSDETVTPSQVNETGGFSHFQTVTPEPDVTDEKPQKANNSAECDGVTDENAPLEGEYADLPPQEETAL